MSYIMDALKQSLPVPSLQPDPHPFPPAVTQLPCEGQHLLQNSARKEVTKMSGQRGLALTEVLYSLALNNSALL